MKILYGQSSFLWSVKAALRRNGTSFARNGFHVRKISGSVYFTASVDVAYSCLLVRCSPKDRLWAYFRSNNFHQNF